MESAASKYASLEVRTNINRLVLTSLGICRAGYAKGNGIRRPEGLVTDLADRGPMSNFDPSRLAEIRRSKGLTQRALARVAGVSQALVAELERGKHPPSSASLSKIISALGIREEELRGGR
jgi:putative transcriptional regulator